MNSHRSRYLLSKTTGTDMFFVTALLAFYFLGGAWTCILQELHNWLGTDVQTSWHRRREYAHLIRSIFEGLGRQAQIQIAYHAGMQLQVSLY
ncbi:hypothetical protein BOTBODRAFT_254088 [Botryobasidium botryosum FD-172 SS1]|uniref:Uncharacterized protein n=1 Tax=Botryobasidium botryosum (strain FD-172 SS1) TaxID=930990 RepID=A0A067LTM5_BOTB1|nr:hypothetical protein BOTBODRAFT_254088 [Botryobasidium botryosum FD-172 SS1]